MATHESTYHPPSLSIIFQPLVGLVVPLHLDDLDDVGEPEVAVLIGRLDQHRQLVRFQRLK